MKMPSTGLLDRYEVSQQLHESISALEIAYQQTGNAYILKSLEIQRGLLAGFERNEVVIRQYELDLALSMLPELPHAVRTWLLFYRDKEMN